MSREPQFRKLALDASPANKEVVAFDTADNTWKNKTPAEQGYIVINKTAVESVNNSATLQNDDHFTFSIGASEVWVAHLSLTVVIRASSDFKVSWSLPSGGTFFHQMRAWDRGGALVTSESSTGALSYLVAATIEHAEIFAVLTNSSTAGTAVLQWAQVTAIAEDTQVQTGSFMTASLVQ